VFFFFSIHFSWGLRSLNPPSDSIPKLADGASPLQAFAAATFPLGYPG